MKKKEEYSFTAGAKFQRIIYKGNCPAIKVYNIREKRRRRSDTIDRCLVIPVLEREEEKL